MKKIIQYFIDKPLIVNVITVFIFVAGIMVYQQMTKQAFPDVEEPGVTVITRYPGASPEDVEVNVTKPIEDAIESIEGIDKFYGYSYENYSEIRVVFDKEFEDYSVIKQDIRREIDNITTFPEEVDEKPSMYDWGGKYAPVLTIGMSGKDVSKKVMFDRVTQLKDKLLDSPYVSKVTKQGVQDREVHIKVDLDKMRLYYISFDEVIKAIRSHNIQKTSGTLKSYTSEKNIITLSRFNTIDEVKNVIIRSNYLGNKVYLYNIAEVEDTFEEERELHRFNGSQGVLLRVFKKEKLDIVNSANEVKKIVNTVRDQLKQDGINMSIILDYSKLTNDRLSIVKNNAIIGLVLVIILLFIFLNFKNAFWTAIGIPFSICFAIIFMPYFDVTINSVSLLGLIIVLGMIVDDAIVVSENIHRYRIEKKRGMTGAVEATYEICFAILTTIMTTIVAFLPLLLLEGEVGQYIREIPILISFVLIGSLFESIFILPNHCSHHMKKGQKIALGFLFGFFISLVLGKFFSFPRPLLWLSLLIGGTVMALFFNFFYQGEDEDVSAERTYINMLRKKYGVFLRIILKFRYLFLPLVFAVLIIGFRIHGSLDFEFFPSINTTIVNIEGDMKQVKSLAYTSDQIKQLEQEIQKKFDKSVLTSFVTRIGGQGHIERFNLNLYLTSEEKRDISTDEVIKTVKEIIKSQNKIENVSYEKTYLGAASGTGNNIRIHVAGHDDKVRKKLAAMVIDDLKKIKGVANIKRSDYVTKSKLQILPRYDKVAQNNITALNISDVLHIAYDGYVVTEVQTPIELISYRIMLQDKYRRKISTLNQLNLMNDSRMMIPVSSVVSVRETKAETEIRHYNGYRTIDIYADIDVTKITPSRIYFLLKNKYKDELVKYQGFRIVLGGGAEFSARALNDLLSTLIISIAAIFVLLIFLFKSITQPFIVMLVVPFGIVGVAIAFRLHNMPLSFMGYMGIIGLTGVIINDSLIMIEYINKIRAEHKKKNIIDVIVNGAVTRMRPIIITSLTTFCGLVPTVYGIGGKDALVLPGAMAIAWGLLFATIITLFILPIFYHIERDVRLFINKLFQLLFQLRIKKK